MGVNTVKQIHFTQQVPFRYIPLKWGLGYLTDSQVKSSSIYTSFLKQGIELCPKVFTTRTRKLRGHYIVTEGSRYHPKPVEPKIEFVVNHSYPIDIDKEQLIYNGKCIDVNSLSHNSKNKNNFIDSSLSHNSKNIIELDLGISGVGMSDLKSVLMQLTNGSKSQFYVNKLEPIRKPKLPMVI